MTVSKMTYGLLFAVTCGFTALATSSSALAQRLHRGNWDTPEARSCAQYVESKYNRMFRDPRDASQDSERAIQITFYSVARVPNLFGGHKHVSMAVREDTFEGEEVVETRRIRNASYCVLDDNNRVIALEAEMR
jgi:hypothetical protein